MVYFCIQTNHILHIRFTLGGVRIVALHGNKVIHGGVIRPNKRPGMKMIFIYLFVFSFAEIQQIQSEYTKKFQAIQPFHVIIIFSSENSIFSLNPSHCSCQDQIHLCICKFPPKELERTPSPSNQRISFEKWKLHLRVEECWSLENGAHK